jgi:hypothetical protein
MHLLTRRRDVSLAARRRVRLRATRVFAAGRLARYSQSAYVLRARPVLYSGRVIKWLDIALFKSDDSASIPLPKNSGMERDLLKPS